MIKRKINKISNSCYAHNHTGFSARIKSLFVLLEKNNHTTNNDREAFILQLQFNSEIILTHDTCILIK